MLSRNIPERSAIFRNVPQLPIPLSHTGQLFGRYRLFCVYRSSLPFRNAPVGRFRQRAIEKRPDLSDGTFLCWRYLFSHAVTRILSSTNLSLTSVFGMGTGGPSGQSTPTSSRQASYPSLPPTRFRVPSRARSFRCLSSPVQTRLRWALNGAHVFSGSWDPLRIVS